MAEYVTKDHFDAVIRRLQEMLETSAGESKLERIEIQNQLAAILEQANELNRKMAQDLEERRQADSADTDGERETKKSRRIMAKIKRRRVLLPFALALLLVGTLAPIWWFVVVDSPVSTPSPLERAQAVAETFKDALGEAGSFENLGALSELEDEDIEIFCDIAGGVYEPDLKLDDITDNELDQISFGLACVVLESDLMSMAFPVSTPTPIATAAPIATATPIPRPLSLGRARELATRIKAWLFNVGSVSQMVKLAGIEAAEMERALCDIAEGVYEPDLGLAAITDGNEATELAIKAHCRAI